jgi:hypothetical protein
MPDDTPLPFDLPSVRRKKLTVDFDGGNQSSNGGLLLLREKERALGVCRRLSDAMLQHQPPARLSTRPKNTPTFVGTALMIPPCTHHIHRDRPQERSCS